MGAILRYTWATCHKLDHIVGCGQSVPPSREPTVQANMNLITFANMDIERHDSTIIQIDLQRREQSHNPSQKRWTAVVSETNCLYLPNIMSFGKHH